MLIELVNAVINTNISIIKKFIVYNKKELYEVLIDNIYIFYIKNIHTTIFNLLLYFLDKHIIIQDLDEKIVKLLVLNGHYKHLTLNKVDNICLFNKIDYYFNKNVLINDNIISNIISKFLIIQYNYNHNNNYIKYIYYYINKNLTIYHMLYFYKKILILSYGYRNNDYIYYCYGYENELLEWSFTNNKYYLIKLL
jgi:hypothetical protein